MLSLSFDFARLLRGYDAEQSVQTFYKQRNWIERSFKRARRAIPSPTAERRGLMTDKEQIERLTGEVRALRLYIDAVNYLMTVS